MGRFCPITSIAGSGSTNCLAPMSAHVFVAQLSSKEPLISTFDPVSLIACPALVMSGLPPVPIVARTTQIGWLRARKQTTQQLQASCQSMARHRQISFRQVQTRKSWPIEDVWYRVPIGTAYPSFLGGYRHEVLVKLCRPLSDCHPVNDITERHGSLANRNRRRHPASHHHGRSAEACGEATAGGKAGAGGNRGNSCISPDSGNPSSATGSARFSTGEDCGA